MRIRKKIKDFNIQRKYFVVFLLTILIPLSIYLLLDNYYGNREIEAAATKDAQHMFQQGKSFVEYKLRLFENNVNSFVWNNDIQEIFTTDALVYRRDVRIWISDYNRIIGLISALKSQTYASGTDVRVYIVKGMTEICETLTIRGMSNDTNEYFTALFGEKSNPMIWTSRGSVVEKGDGDFVYLIGKIVHKYEPKRVLGMLEMQVRLSTFTEVIANVAYLPASASYIIDENDNIICAAGDFDALAGLVAPVCAMLDAPALRDGAWDVADLSDGRVLYGAQNIVGTPWKMVFMVPYAEILKAKDTISTRVLLIIIVTGILALPAAYIASRSSTKRIRLLARQMNEVEKGNLNVPALAESKDEVGQLNQRFNAMIANINALAARQYEMGKTMKNAELKALQSQINPHFLYNTLDLIYWKALKNNNNDICTIVTTLSNFYRLSLNHGEDVVPLGHELAHIRAYVAIQNIRFDNRIALSIQVPEDVLHCSIPKITLQPLVENAIIHGINETVDERGSITVSCEIGADMLLIVEDDGVGIPQEKLITILNTDDSGLGGYGISNIQNRLRLMFGERYGLEFHSGPDGTRVAIRLPVPASRSA